MKAIATKAVQVKNNAMKAMKTLQAAEALKATKANKAKKAMKNMKAMRAMVAQKISPEARARAEHRKAAEKEEIERHTRSVSELRAMIEAMKAVARPPH